MGFNTYAREFLCAVCGSLVFPREAWQAMCRHIFCNFCLLHIAYGSRACPCDGSHVTESHSKPLLDSDKGLAEKINKVKVHCPYIRSGCTWQGALLDCASHICSCSFGTSPVLCIKCGLQMMHSQVKEHAQNCHGNGRILSANGNQNTPTGLPRVYPPIPSFSGQFSYQIPQHTQYAVQYHAENPPVSLSGHIFYQQHQALQQCSVLPDASTTRCPEKVPGDPLHRIRSSEAFGQNSPAHLMMREFPGSVYMPGHYNVSAAAGPGAITGHVPRPEFGFPRNIPHQLPFHQSIIGGGSRNRDANDSGMGRGCCLQGFSHDRSCAGDVGSFDQLGMIKPARDMDRGEDSNQFYRKKQRVSAGILSVGTGSGARKVGGHGS